MGCEINIENGRPVVKTYPKLMREIMTYSGFDIEQSMDLYGIVLTDEFKMLGIKNPSLDNILAFNEQMILDEDNSLNKLDKNNLINLRLQSKPIEDFKQELLDSLTVDGVFGIDTDKLEKSNLFSQSDILEMDNPENVENLKQLYYKLRNTDEKVEAIQSEIIVKNNLFDKSNPDEVTQDIYDIYAGLETSEEVYAKAQEYGDQRVLENMELIPYIVNMVKNKQQLVQYESDEYSGELVKKESNNFVTKLEQTFDTQQDVSPLLQQLEFIRELPIEYYVTELETVMRYLENIEIQAAELGIDIDQLSELILDKNSNEIVEFLDSMYNFLYDVYSGESESIDESLEMFAESHNVFFGTTPSFKKATVEKLNKDGVFVHLETSKSQEELFKEKGLLKIKDNIYQKIKDDKTLQELYGMFMAKPNLLPKGTITVKNAELNSDIMVDEVDQYISSQAKKYLSEKSDIESVKKLTAYHILLGTKEVEQPTVDGIEGLDVNRFLIDFNKILLANESLKSLFYFSNRGLESSKILAEFTNEILKNELSPKEYSDLVQYSKISGNESLSYIANQEGEVTTPNPRDYYANNMGQLEQYDKYYTKEKGYVVTDSTDQFLKINSELYESVAPNVYGKVDRSGRYRNQGTSKPEYDNSVTPNIKKQDGGKIKVSKVKEINDNEIEFC